MVQQCFLFLKAIGILLFFCLCLNNCFGHNSLHSLYSFHSECLIYNKLFFKVSITQQSSQFSQCGQTNKIISATQSICCHQITSQAQLFTGLCNIQYDGCNKVTASEIGRSNQRLYIAKCVFPID